jgi:hypothetical protein
LLARLENRHTVSKDESLHTVRQTRAARISICSAGPPPTSVCRHIRNALPLGSIACASSMRRRLQSAATCHEAALSFAVSGIRQFALRLLRLLLRLLRAA